MNDETEPTLEPMIRVMVFRPGQPPEVRTIANDIKSLQQIVDGYIECVTLSHGLVLTCNEEGKLHDLPFNRRVRGSGGEDDLVGTFLISRIKGPEYASLTDADIRSLEQWAPDVCMMFIHDYRIAADGKSITCNLCGMTSYDLSDVLHRYCGNCHKFLD